MDSVGGLHGQGRKRDKMIKIQYYFPLSYGDKHRKDMSSVWDCLGLFDNMK